MTLYHPYAKVSESDQQPQTLNYKIMLFHLNYVFYFHLPIIENSIYCICRGGGSLDNGYFENKILKC
jgi:hypothetical protein